MTVPFSILPDIAWPAISQANTGALWSLLFQLEQSQWWPADKLRDFQFRQLALVMEHAYRTVPFYRQRLEQGGLDPAGPWNPERFGQVPLLSRRDVQLAGNGLHSQQAPAAHGPVGTLATSGSTGEPVVSLANDVTRLFWRAFTLRDHVWHRRDLARKLAAIRYLKQDVARPPNGHQEPNWGAATAGLFATGPAYLLNVHSTIAQQVDWLLRVEPDYLLCYPSALLGICRELESRGIAPPRLLELRTFGEILEPHCRETCQRVLGAPVVDFYSSQELGYIALQCPDCENYHLQSENLLVEVLDERGQACAPGEIGRVVVTTLHNFAMPLVRYELGDFAQVGEPCSCGRGLGVLTRILGRQRNLLRLPGGQQKWPLFDRGGRAEELPAFFQFQIVQRSLSQIEVQFVRHAPLDAAEASFITRHMQDTLGHHFDVVLKQVESIPRSAFGKFEDFVSLVGEA